MTKVKNHDIIRRFGFFIIAAIWGEKLINISYFFSPNQQQQQQKEGEMGTYRHEYREPDTKGCLVRFLALAVTVVAVWVTGYLFLKGLAEPDPFLSTPPPPPAAGDRWDDLGDDPPPDDIPPLPD